MAKAVDHKLASIERHYQRVYRHLDPSDLKRHEDWPSHTDPVTAAGDDDARFLGYYSAEGLRIALEHYGFLDEIRKKNLGGPELTLRRHEKGYDVVQLHCATTPVPLVELVAQVSSLSESARKHFNAEEGRFLFVRWLRMQNPRVPARPDRPLLPGQDYPGLELGRQMMVLLQLICSRLELDGVVELPERLHNAALYFRRFCFVDPVMQGQLTAILRDTRDRTLVDLAWGVELSGLYDRSTGKPFRWKPSEQVLPRTGAILEYVNSDDYKKQARLAMEQSSFYLSSGDLAKDLAVSPSESRIK